MAKAGEVYKCEVCGNIVIVVHGGQGDLVCCGQNMKHMVENTVDAAKEKHVPVIEIDGDMVTVKVGSVPHPMEEKHYIEWIELAVDNKYLYQALKPGDEPKATFCLCGMKPKEIRAREYCNIHGLWVATA